jgi:hypothetical protein
MILKAVISEDTCQIRSAWMVVATHANAALLVQAKRLALRMCTAVSTVNTGVDMSTKSAIAHEATVADTIVFARSRHVTSGIAATATMAGLAWVNGKAGLTIASETLGAAACAGARTGTTFCAVSIGIAHAILRHARVIFGALEPVNVITSLTIALAGASTSLFANAGKLITTTIICSTGINWFTRRAVTLETSVASAIDLASFFRHSAVRIFVAITVVDLTLRNQAATHTIAVEASITQALSSWHTGCAAFAASCVC